MAELKYTKGEWRIHPTHKTDIYALNNGSKLVAECGNPNLPNGEDLANAHLISASPDMYEALKGIMSLHIKDYDSLNMGIGIKTEGGQILIRAEKALAKAEGRS